MQCNMELKDIVIKDSREFEDQDALCQKLLDIDQICYSDLGEEDTGPVEYWGEVNRYAFRQIALYCNEIIGYVDMTKFSDIGVDMLSRGQLREGQMVEYLDRADSKSVNLYIVSIALLSQFRNIGLASLLFNEVIGRIRNEGYIIKSIYCTVWTEEGMNFFKAFNSTIINYDVTDHPVVKISIP